MAGGDCGEAFVLFHYPILPVENLLYCRLVPALPAKGDT